MTSVKALSAAFDTRNETWTISFEVPAGTRKLTCKHLVQATGFTSQIPYVPSIPGRDSYQGVDLHSAEYKNPKQFQEKGLKVSLCNEDPYTQQ